MVSLMGCTVAYSPSRTPRHDLYPGYGAVITSGQPYYVSTGYLYDTELLFKIAVLVYNCLKGLAPSYLAGDSQLVSDVRPRQLRSSDSVTCAVRRTRTAYGDRCFAVAGPRVFANRTKAM